jgi:hypothetical protein
MSSSLLLFSKDFVLHSSITLRKPLIYLRVKYIYIECVQVAILMSEKLLKGIKMCANTQNRSNLTRGVSMGKSVRANNGLRTLKCCVNTPRVDEN